MNSKMVKNTYPSTIEPEKQTKQPRTETESWIQSILMVARWEGCGRMGGEVRGLRSTNRQLQNSHGDVKYSVGNGEAKELIPMTHGHEQLVWGLPEGVGVLGGGLKGGKIRTTVIA